VKSQTAKAFGVDRADRQQRSAACAHGGGQHLPERRVYKDQVPVTPATNELYQRRSESGAVTGTVLEAVYTFAPGTGHTVMDKVRAAVANGCGDPQNIKLLAVPQTGADEVIIYTDAPGVHNILVRSGDRIASAVTDPQSAGTAGTAGTAWLDHLAEQMAVRLTSG
jgi:hypothetical protein